MTDDGIFLIQNDALHVLKPQPYESEALLQQALATFPAVLAGSSTSETGRKDLLLVRREMGVPTADGTPATFSLDHLFIDSEAVPVVVEVKRSTDTRIRREVIGQMIDYAANAVKYWPVESLRDAFEATVAGAGGNADQRLSEFLAGGDPDAFWRQVSDNLAAGRIRMLFVADELPDELVRAIEFLNEQMNPAEVLGIEVPQFVGEGHQVLVPRVIGRTSSAVALKQAARGRTWNEGSFLSATLEAQGSEVADFFVRLFDHVRRHGGTLRWGRALSPGVSAIYTFGPTQATVCTGNSGATPSRPRGYVYFWLPEIRAAAPERFDTLLTMLEAIPPYRSHIEDARRRGFDGTYPTLPLHEILGQPEDVEALFSALDFLAVGTPSNL